MSNFKNLVSNMLKSAESSLLQRYCLLLWDNCYTHKKGVLIKATEQNKSQVKCLILGVQHYQEEVVDYPIARYRDLIKVLKLEQKSSDKPFLFHIQKFDGKNRQVKKAYYSNQLLIDNQVEPLFLLPESWVISQSLNNNVVQYQQQERQYICVPSQYKNTVIELKGLLSNKEDACTALVVPQDIKYVEKDEPWLISQLLNGRNLIALWPLFIGLKVTYKEERQQIDVLVFCTGTSFVLVSYLLITSLLLGNSVKNLQEESDRLNAQLSPLLSLIEQTNQSKARAEQFANLNKVKGWEITDWRSISTLFTNGIKLININFLSTGKIALKIRSTSLSSSDVLELLLSQKSIAKADFLGGVKKNKNYQDYTIIVELNVTQAQNQEEDHG